MFLVTLFVLLYFQFGAGVRYVPHSPCPKLFNYFESETQEVFGAMTFDNDLTGHYVLVMEMSIATKTDKVYLYNNRLS